MSKPFKDVQTYELKQVAVRRAAVHGHEKPDATQPAEPLQQDLVGLAFSGGGIRSATFNLGILQALGRLGLLTRIDYLSTVSGGGYIGGWLAAWIHRSTGTARERVLQVEKRLNPSTNRAEAGEAAGLEPEPATVRHLRAHSRYLAPRYGVFSLDTWTLPAIYVRNLFVNLLIVGPAILGLALLCRLVVVGFNLPTEGTAGIPDELSQILAVSFGLMLLFGFCVMRWQLAALAKEERRKTEQVARADQAPSKVPQPPTAGPVGQSSPLKRAWWATALTIALSAAALLGIWLLGPTPDSVPDALLSRMPNLVRSYDRSDASSMLLHDIKISVIVFATLGGIAAIFTFVMMYGLGLRRQFWSAVLTLVYSLAFGFGFVVIVNRVLFIDDGLNHPALFATISIPLLFATILLAGYVETGLAGSFYTEYELEWRSRLAAILLRVSIAWLVVFAAVVYIPWALTWTASRFKTVGPLLPWGALVGWLLTTAGGVLAARRSAQPGSGKTLVLFAKLVPPVFLIGLLAIASHLSLILTELSQQEASEQLAASVQQTEAAGEQLSWSAWLRRLLRSLGGPVDRNREDIGEPDVAQEPDYVTRLENAVPLHVVYWLVGVTVAGGVFFLIVPATRFSLHSLYLNRLCRCYLGASLRDSSPNHGEADLVHPRHPNLFTGFDPNDDFPLTDLQVTGPDDKVNYLGPYPLFNTTLNLVAGVELAYQDRKGASFVLTPAYCGSDQTEYEKLDPANKENLTVGRAITISGAAVDPNMNVYQSPALTMFLTLLNARLGWWLANPKKATSSAPWTADTPRNGAWSYAKELFGKTDAEEAYVHLSDGGHFENTGAYELIRRRCRYVIVVDAAEDALDSSENLANLIRLVRTDFGIAIDIDTSPLRKDEKGLSRWHCATGAIRYDEVDPSGVTGTLVFIRSSLTGDEDADLRNYAATHPPFPHHSTLDQFFEEAQFESYRDLGYHIGMSVFASAKEAARRSKEGENGKEDNQEGQDGERRYRGDTRRFFATLRREWSPLPDGAATGYITSCRDYLAAVGQLRKDRELRKVSSSLFPEMEQWMPKGEFNLTDLHEIEVLLQTMELSWMENDLDRFHAHPLNRGWMNVLRRWTASTVFHYFWPVLRSQYTRSFVRFCERALNLDPLPVQWCRISDIKDVGKRDKILDEFNREFYREWAGVLSASHRKEEVRRSYLTEAIKNSSLKQSEPMAWVLTTGTIGDPPGEIASWREGHLPLGMVIVFEPMQANGPGVSLDQRELLVWVRGPYRSLGLGRESVEELIETLISPQLKAGGVTELVVRYPKVGTSYGDRLQRILWTWFFNDIDFVLQPTADRARKETEVLLVRRLAATEAKQGAVKSGEIAQHLPPGPPADGPGAGSGTPG